MDLEKADVDEKERVGAGRVRALEEVLISMGLGCVVPTRLGRRARNLLSLVRALEEVIIACHRARREHLKCLSPENGRGQI